MKVFGKKLLEKLSQQTYVNNNYEFKKFCNITSKIMDKYVTRKAKHAGDK